MNEELRVEDEPRLQEVAALEDRLYQHNVAVTGCDDGRWLAIFVRDGAGELMAGAGRASCAPCGSGRISEGAESGRASSRRPSRRPPGAAAGRCSSTPTAIRRPTSTGARATSRSASCRAGPARRPRASSSGRRSDHRAAVSSRHGRIAQRTERSPYKADVAGSNPAPPTTNLPRISGDSASTSRPRRIPLFVPFRPLFSPSNGNQNGNQPEEFCGGTPLPPGLQWRTPAVCAPRSILCPAAFKKN